MIIVTKSKVITNSFKSIHFCFSHSSYYVQRYEAAQYILLAVFSKIDFTLLRSLSLRMLSENPLGAGAPYPVLNPINCKQIYSFTISLNNKLHLYYRIDEIG